MLTVHLFIEFIHGAHRRYRHYRNLCSKVLPTALKGYVSEEQFRKAQAYGRDKTRYSFSKATFSLVQESLWLTCDVLPWLWGVSGRIMFRFLGLDSKHEIVQSLIFFQFKSCAEALIELPFDFYEIFVIEERHGFNKQSWKLFISDFVVKTLVQAVFEMPFYAGLIKVFKTGGPNFYIYAWLFVVAFQLLMTTVYPTVIMPLFNTFTPLPKGELNSMIEALANSVQFPLQKLFVVDGSKRSGHSNAYFYGFFKNKRIVLFDTLLDHSSNHETCAVLAHELGHWNYNHSFNLLAGSLFEIFIAFFLFSRIISNKDLFTSFGFSHSTPTLVGYILFEFLYAPVSKITGFIRNTVARQYEFLADAFACDLGYASSLSSGLIKLQLKNLGNMNPDWLYSVYHRNHPELVERLNAIKQRVTILSKTNKTD
ncbi:MAG: putative caax prenyl protease ste24 [Podila humilis]|nr:MAG: putative caax prenyl protease ste24 [Podila humilis]